MKTFTTLLYLFCSALVCSAKSPHILFIVADDLGWNDVGFHNPDMITPNIDKLAYSGLILNQAYVQPVCTPSRNSWMSGYFPFRSGLQHLVILPQQATCAPLNRTYLPQELKKLGYATHMIGKWHLGFCSWDCTPTYRGFDSFFGYYNGAEDYYSHVIQKGKDFRDDKKPTEADGEYSAHVYAKRARQIINDHNATQPMFLYLPFQSVHEPIQVPKKYEDMYSQIKNDGRRKYSGMVTAMDEAIGNITQALKERDMFDDTLILFTADNGGWPTYSGNNYPLRGSKTTVFEGGTRAASFITGAGINAKNETYNGMLHAVDWMPTLVAAAGGSISNADMDGMDQWTNIQTRTPSKRTEFVYNLDDMNPPLTGHAAIRYGNYKLIQGYPGMYPGWYKPATVEVNQEIEELPYERYDEKTWAGQNMLFDLDADPNEHNDLSREHPDIVKKMSDMIQEYKRKMVPANYPANDPKSDPSNYDGFWTPGWC
ncbi:hypothetical protein FSP39_004703 [Pinctada imbricata]|uniref:Sulfatase N-terminal domain-containing protein n=1 Tax=Pinctada imbricata TaxID=66713 RepID=A0AA88YUP0_PINIB|nr:hypothetical protein FSP39_004703 [Pinctada imbricata]